MRWLITGSGGRLGTALIARLAADDTGLTGAEDDVVLPLDRGTLDITNADAVREAVADFGPDVVINAAAGSAGEPGSELGDAGPDDAGLYDAGLYDAGLYDAGPDDAGADDGQAGADDNRAYPVRAVGPAVLASAVAETGGRFVHVCSELAFAGESAVRELLPNDGYVVRTSWLYGGAGDEIVRRAVRLVAAVDHGDDAETAARSAARDDRRGSPTWVDDLAEGLIALSRSDAPAGIYRCANSGQTTRLGFARAVLSESAELDERADPDRPDVNLDLDRPDLDPASRTTDIPSSAAPSLRPGQEWVAAGLAPLPDWRDALHRAFVLDGERVRTN